MSGDTHAALQAISDAENKGGFPGEWKMPRWSLRLAAGNPGKRVYLEQAERQLPESVAVKQLPAQTHAFEGEFWRADDVIAALDKLQPQTTEDYVFLGLAEGVMNPDRGTKTMWPLACQAARPGPAYLCPGCISRRAGNEGGPADAERALDDIRKADLPDDHALVVLYRFNACMEGANATGALDGLPGCPVGASRPGLRAAWPVSRLPDCGPLQVRLPHVPRRRRGTLERSPPRPRRVPTAPRSSTSSLTSTTAGSSTGMPGRLAEGPSTSGQAPESVAMSWPTLPERKGEAVAAVEEAMRTIKGGPHVTFCAERPAAARPRVP